MIAIGAICAAIAVAAACCAARRDSVVRRRLARLAPGVGRAPRWRPVGDRDLRQAALFGSQTQLVGAKVLCGAVGLTMGLAAGGVLGAGVPLAIALGYAGSVVPSVAVERAAARERRGADRALGQLVERLEALIAAGRPVETALATAARTPTSSELLDHTLRQAADAYVLGAPLFGALAVGAEREGIAGLGALATALERSRDLGRGSISAIRDARDAARTTERNGLLEAAAQVEGKLMLTLVLCYLPALMLLVVIPLFMTLLDGLFG